MPIIPFSSTSFTDIKESINQYLDENASKYQIIDNYDGSTRTMLVDLLAGFATYMNYKTLMYYNNAFIRTALSNRAILELSTNRYGYNFNRAVSPKLKIVYNENNITTKIVNTGEILGSININNEILDLVYFEKTKEVHPGEEIIVSIGKLNHISGNFLNYNFDDKIFIELFSSEMQIDNNDVVIFINNEQKEITKDPEYYIVEEKVLDMSVYYNKCKLYISEPSTLYGLKINPTDNYDIYYLETFKRIINLNEYIDTIKFEDNFYFKNIESYGDNEDSIEKIRRIAPLYYTTFRVMSNLESHKIIASGYPGVLDIYVEKNKYKCCNLDWYVLLDFSTDEPRVFSDYEKEKYIKYLNKYKFVGMSITPENIKAPFVKKREWVVVVKYNCDIIKYEGVNEIISNYVREVINQKTLKLGVKFTMGEILAEITKMKYGTRNIIEEVQIFEDFNDYHSVLPASEYYAAPNEYYWIDLRVEVQCKED